MCTGLSEIPNYYEQSTLLLVAIIICIPSYREDDIQLLSLITKFPLSHFTTQSLHRTVNICTVYMLGFWLFRFNAGSLAWDFVCYCAGVVFVIVIFVWFFQI